MKSVRLLFHWTQANFWQQLSNGWLSLIYNLAFRGFIHILTIAGLIIWEFRKYYPYTVGEARMRLFPKIWEPKHCRRSRGRRATTFIDQLETDTSLSRQDLASVIANRQEWERFQSACTRNWYIDPYTTENIIIHTLNNPRRECWKSFTLSG